VPPGIAHAVVNEGGDVLLCVACAEQEHDPDDVVPFDVRADSGQGSKT
jgi:hypothetical protein